MFFLNYVVFILIILFSHLICLSTQALSSNKYFFGVYINQIELENEFKTKINKDFKRKLNITLLISILSYLISKDIFNLNIAAGIVMGTTIYFILFFFILRIEYKNVKYVKDVYLSNVQEEDKEVINIKIIIREDEILTKRKKKIIKKFKILFGISIALSLMSFIYVAINYNNLPDVIITHWGAAGQPDGYSKKNIIDVFFVNFIDISMVLLFAFITIGTICGNTYIDDSNLEENRKKAVKYLNGVGYSFFALILSMQALTTTMPVFMVNQSDIPMWLTIGGCIVPIVIVVPMIYYYLMLSNIKPKNKSVHTIESDDANWIYGFIYYNKEDPRPTVEKRFGMGWGINMAHPLGKAVTILLVVITVGSILICFI